VQFGRERKPPILSRPEAEAAIHRLARENKFLMADVVETDDAIMSEFELKMLVRNFDMRQVLETIKQGVINQGPTLDQYSEWRCRVKRRVAGRLVRVVVALSSDLSFMTLISVH
jgi:hypothetical protein